MLTYTIFTLLIVHYAIFFVNIGSVYPAPPPPRIFERWHYDGVMCSRYVVSAVFYAWIVDDTESRGMFIRP